jgi:diguanylate cyclase (GGDEF)-like protein
MTQRTDPTPEQSRILVVDDDAASRDALATVLREAGYEVITAQDGASALDLLNLLPDLVVSDLTMPHLGGFGLVQCIRSSHQCAEVPIILVSAHGDSASRVHGFEFGADDFLSKPIQFDELLARIARHLSRSPSRRETARLSVSDELTGMLNRRGIRNFFARIRNDDAMSAQPVSVLLIDVTKFKLINDRYGHAVGDLALCAVGRALQDAVRASDRVGRIGGDEFLVVLPGASQNACARLQARLQANLPLKLELTDNDQVAIGFAVGAATGQDGETLEALTARADRSMYAGKRASESQANGSSAL